MRSRLPCALALLTAACGGDAALVEFAVFPQELTLPPASYTDTTPRWESVAVLNETFFELGVTGIELSGPDAALLEVNDTSAKALDLRESKNILVRVRPPTTEVLGDWDTGAREAVLRFRVRGTATDANAIEEVPYEVPISFRIVCDIDQDGFDATQCGDGRDCNDREDDVRPSADEICDGIDNDCNDVIDDEGCTELP